MCSRGYYLFFSIREHLHLSFLVKGVHLFKQIIVKTLVNTSANFHVLHRNVNGSIIDPNEVTYCSMIHVLTVPLTWLPNFNTVFVTIFNGTKRLPESGVLAQW